MMIFASVEECAHVLQAFFEALVTPCCYRVKKKLEAKKTRSGAISTG